MVCWILSAWLHFYIFPGVYIMYLLYLDDSGSAKNKNEDYLVLGEISVFERQAHFLTKQLDEIALDISPNDPTSVEFHASHIFSGKDIPWKGMVNRNERRKIISRVLSVLANAHESVHAFACAIHKESYSGHDPMELAFEDLCSRFDMLLTRHYSSGDNQRGLIVLDKSSYETSLQKLAQKFKTTGTTYRKLKNIVEVPLFVDSKASRLIQLADHVAYSVFKRYEKGDTSFLDPILKRFDSHDGTMHGLVHKQTIDANCMCPACMSRR